MQLSTKKILLFLGILFLTGLVLSQNNHTEAQDKEATLTVGLQSGYPPFEFRNAEGEIIGFDIDIAKLIADQMGKKLIINDMEFEGEILSLKQGKIDLIISGMNITSSRLKEIAMIPYHGEEAESLSLIFWNEIPTGIHSLGDLTKIPNAIVSVEAGAVTEAYLSQFPDIQAKSFDGALAPLMDVKFGKSIANLVQTDVARYLQQKHPEIQILTIPLPDEEKILGFGIGVKKNNQELFEKVSSIIKELKDSGKLKQIENQWFKGES